MLKAILNYLYYTIVTVEKQLRGLQWIVNVVVHSVHKNTSRNVTGEQQQVNIKREKSMKKTIASGVWPVMITPFTEDNRIDYDAVL